MVKSVAPGRASSAPTTRSPCSSVMPFTPNAARPIERTSFWSKRMAMPCEVPMITSSSPFACMTATSSSSSSMDRGFRTILVVLLRRPQLLHCPQRGDLLALREGDQVDDGLAPGCAPGLRQLMHLEPEHAALAGEDEHVGVRAGDEDLLDEVLFGGARAGLPAPSAPLRA